MWKPIAALIVALGVVNCSGDRLVEPYQKVFLEGAYKGTIEGFTCGGEGQEIKVVEDVDFTFSDSTYWWQGAKSSRFPEWGSGDYDTQGDSLFMTDSELRLWYRCYIITDGSFSFAQNGDTLCFWHEQPSTGSFLRATLIKED